MTLEKPLTTIAIASLVCTILWEDSWPIWSLQYPEQVEEVQVSACMDGQSVEVVVNRRLKDGPGDGQWRQEVKKCWEGGKEGYCGY